MKIATKADNLAVLSLDSGMQTSEFKIRATSKSFQILSSGLYSNKIKAIIRELSTNAYDSHVDAGKGDIPFEVHLPSTLEPWFSVKDFGTGLSGEQVTSVYTTYFESTKTESNDFVGALGLGSKSPFSYTDNFTITAIKGGIKRIYSAFIADSGVPAVAEMCAESTTESSGVEIKFSVTNRNDFYSFKCEAQEVFKWFKTKPNVTGIYGFEIPEISYKEKSIIDGIHLSASSYESVALMGNIAYPITDVPNVEGNLGDLRKLLQCGLIIEFEIGELDFAASRERISYIPSTIQSIKSKLELLSKSLVSYIAKDADIIQNKWEKSDFLCSKLNEKLFHNAVVEYVTSTGFDLFKTTYPVGRSAITVDAAKLASERTKIQSFRVQFYPAVASQVDIERADTSTYPPKTFYEFNVCAKTVFVLNDLKTGCLSRAKYHFTSIGQGVTVHCISHNNPDLVERQKYYDAFIDSLQNPPLVIKASTLDARPKKATTPRSGILTLKVSYPHGYNKQYAWHQVTDAIDDNKTYYYVELTGHSAKDSAGKPLGIKQVYGQMIDSGVKSLKEIVIYGVRKNRIDEIKELDNWVPLEDKIREELALLTDTSVAFAIGLVDSSINTHYTTVTAQVAGLVDKNSVYYMYYKTYFTKKSSIDSRNDHLAALCRSYRDLSKVASVQDTLKKDTQMLLKTYPLLQYLRYAEHKEIADYINLIHK